MTGYPSDIGDFVIAFSPIGPRPLGAWPPFGPVTVQKVIKAYPYEQYEDDDNVTAFFDAYNVYAQAYLDYLNNLNLPVYTNGNISGALLDWVALGLYGIARPVLPIGTGLPALGPPNTWTANQLPLNTATVAVEETFFLTTDDIFKRIITWAFYKGDGKTFNLRWLKRRINRFLNGYNGTDVVNDSTYDISVVPTAPKAWTITLATTQVSTIFKAAVVAGILELPFQIDWTVTLT